jgi:hypothetical protein
MALPFQEVFRKELEVVNFRRDEIRSGKVAEVREPSLELKRARQDSAAEAEARKHFLRDRHRVELALGSSGSDARAVRLSGESDLTGLAFSGGGIRSASFCLGVLQGLDSLSDHGEPHVLDAIDYLSVVSGGSYIGTSLVAGMMQPDYTFPFDSRLDEQETPETKHLRNYSNFLAPNGFFDYIISAILVLRGLLVNAAIVLPIILLLSVVTILFNHTIADLADPDFLGLSLKEYGIPHIAGLPGFVVTTYFAIAMAFALLATAIFTSLTYARGTLQARERLGKCLAWAALLVVLAAVFEFQSFVLTAMFEQAGVATNATDANTGLSSWIASVFPYLSKVLLPAATLLVAFAQRLANVAKATLGEATWTGALKKHAAQFGLYLAAVIVPFLLWVVYIYLTFWGVRQDYQSLYNQFTPGFIKQAADWLAALSFMPGFMAGAIGRAAALYLVIALLLIILALFIAPNSNSLHRLYRDRLSRAFLIKRVGGVENSESADVDRWTFSSLKPVDNETKNWLPQAAYSPYLLVNTAINLEASKELNKRGRNADTFTFSPLFVGSVGTGYVETTAIEKVRPDLSLATAMATSGAAASANMGSQTIKLLTFSLSLLNIRLGYWLANPGHLDDFKRRLVKMAANIGLYFFALETGGLLDETRLNVYLTDGGHIENLGIYELLKRRCKVIVAVDAEADQEMTFPSFANLQVLARIDLGVRIDLPWQDLRESALKVTDQALYGGDGWPGSRGPHAAIGLIQYSEEETGVLIYIKSSLSGDENDYIVDYKRRNGTFPHETTVDQFFSEKQFEVYRALGFHAARNLFTGTDAFGAFSDTPAGWRKAVDDALALLNIPPDMAEKITARCFDRPLPPAAKPSFVPKPIVVE